jgi:hypothetical protein
VVHPSARDFLPTNTGVGSTIATGTDPRVHGIAVNSIYDRVHRRRQDLFGGMVPQALMALTLADVWQLATSGRAIVLAQGSIDRAATPLASHGACQPNGARSCSSVTTRRGCLALRTPTVSGCPTI